LGVTTQPRHRHHRDTTGGADGNERLTAIIGAVLLILFAVEGLTILSLRRLLTLHFLAGMLLLGPVALKIASTAYRFGRYYTGGAEYIRKGPPAPLLRLLGPVVIGMSLAVLGTGVELAFAGPGRGRWLVLHKASFVLWFAVMTVHVVAYAPRLPGLLARRGNGPARRVLAGSRTRWLLVAASLAGGLVVAMLTVHLSARW
jgi:hypothetical protein